jgi:hypothetical protein
VLVHASGLLEPSGTGAHNYIARQCSSCDQYIKANLALWQLIYRV